MPNTTSESRKKQAVRAKISGLRRYALAFLRETERGRFSESTRYLMFDFGTHLLAFAPETGVLMPALEPREVGMLDGKGRRES
jgi:hypothetical protein